jgi:hypothetical protein
VGGCCDFSEISKDNRRSFDCGGKSAAFAQDDKLFLVVDEKLFCSSAMTNFL